MCIRDRSQISTRSRKVAAGRKRSAFSVVSVMNISMTARKSNSSMARPSFLPPGHHLAGREEAGPGHGGVGFPGSHGYAHDGYYREGLSLSPGGDLPGAGGTL